MPDEHRRDGGAGVVGWRTVRQWPILSLPPAALVVVSGVIVTAYLGLVVGWLRVGWPAEAGMTLEDVLRSAELAMEQGKRAGTSIELYGRRDVELYRAYWSLDADSRDE